LIEYLKINPYVNTLNLEHNSIDKPKMRNLGEIIEKSNSIKYLNLSWNNIWEGLSYLSKSLQRNLENKLIELDLSQNKL